mmetsp:Transcript_9158/g.13752  ORF Transcript_9158/g.13752 Transcript_9158/m.13752 type:complete len:128 (-) Transcript_9158:164-547(-)
MNRLVAVAFRTATTPMRANAGALTSVRFSSSHSAPLTKEDLEHTTGLERAELEAELRGETLFDRNGLKGPFGTRAKPVVVPSTTNFRPVACTGGVGDQEHELLWFNLFAGHKHICPECGQFFQLKQV